MDPKHLQGLMEAYSEVYAPIDENRMASRMEKMPSAPAKVGKATHSIKDLAPSKPPTPEENAKARKALGLGEKVEIFDTVLEFLQAEGYAETLEEAEWLMANVIDEEAIDIILDEAEGSYGQTPNARQKMGALAIRRRNTPASEYLKRGAKKAAVNSAQRHFDRMGNPDAGNIGKKSSRPYSPAGRKGMTKKDRDWSRGADEYGHSGYDGEGGGGSLPKGKKLERQRKTGVSEAQEARNNPDKYEREQSKKYAPVRGEKTPMPPRGDKRREDFEKWYAANGPR